MSQRIIVKISKDGKVEATVNGIKGPTCEGKLEALLQGLGEITEERATPEYWEVEQQETVLEGW